VGRHLGLEKMAEIGRETWRVIPMDNSRLVVLSCKKDARGDDAHPIA